MSLDLAVSGLRSRRGRRDGPTRTCWRRQARRRGCTRSRFVEHHRHDRIVVRGTFAGRYVDVDERGDVIGKRTSEGAMTGALVGTLFGPPGFAFGLVAGATAGGLSEAERAPHLHDTFLDEIRVGGAAEVLGAAPAGRSGARRRDGRRPRRARRPPRPPSPDPRGVRWRSRTPSPGTRGSPRAAARPPVAMQDAIESHARSGPPNRTSTSCTSRRGSGRCCWPAASSRG